MLGVMADATGRRRPAAAVAALAQCALVELDRGNLQRAVEHTDTIRDLNPRHHARTARAVGAYATGIIQFSVGEYTTAISSLLAERPALRHAPRSPPGRV